MWYVKLTFSLKSFTSQCYIVQYIFLAYTAANFVIRTKCPGEEVDLTPLTFIFFEKDKKITVVANHSWSLLNDRAIKIKTQTICIQVI